LAAVLGVFIVNVSASSSDSTAVLEENNKDPQKEIDDELEKIGKSIWDQTGIQKERPHVFPHVKRLGLRRGANPELACTVIGYPRPIVYWTRHGRILRRSHKYDLAVTWSMSHDIVQHPEIHGWSTRFTRVSTLTIRSLSKRDYGEYDCVGRNPSGTVAEKVDIYEKRPT